MKLKSLKLLFTVISLFQLAFYKAQLDKITIQKVEVNGTAYSSTVMIPKGVPINIKVYFNIKKNTPSNEMGNNVKLFAKKLGTNYQVFVRSLGNFPTNAGQSQDYVLSENVSNSNVLIDWNDTGNLFMTYNYGNSIEVGSNLIPTSFVQPQPMEITQNNISSGFTTDYLTAGQNIAGSKPNVPVGNYTYSWQKRTSSMTYFWEILDDTGKDYTPKASDNTENYKLRRVVTSQYSQIAQSISNEIEIKVNITGNIIAETIGSDGFGGAYHNLSGSLPKGGDKNYIYQWQEKINGNWTNISNATKQNYKIPPLNSNKTFRRIVKSAGVVDNISNEFEIFGARIVGNLINVQYYLNPQPQKVLAGEKPIFNTLGTPLATVLMSTTAQPLTYQWQKAIAGGSWEDIPGATSALYNINTPIQETTQYRRIVRSLYALDSESNSVTVEVSNYPVIQDNKISFDPSNTDRILGSIPTGGDGNYEYIWAADVHPDDSIGEMVYWGASTGTGTTMSEYINQLPITSDEYHLTRYAISDGVWNRSNTLIYSVSGGIIQGKKAKAILTAPSVQKTVVATVNNNELLFNFKNYSGAQAEVYLVNYSTGRSEKIMKPTILSDNSIQVWAFPPHYLQGVYAYNIVFNDGTVQSGKVIKK